MLHTLTNSLLRLLVLEIAANRDPFQLLDYRVAEYDGAHGNMTSTDNIRHTEY